ncbi:MAG: hypothetical protein KYX67_09220 [Brevundimonas sp.]|uniref:Methyl-accepting chemotaxis protein n=1 Tax=Brevundimonas mediterranea TaxID=74329 RepID=A0A7W6A8A4_9CAUL|nr:MULTISPECIES: hypothetical protein [Brevundimonas]MBB3873590.1 hypothetical protein [Brevundimonas mediterranea]MDK2747487.1 hypothetical protein [Brevundimonas sp.]
MQAQAQHFDPAATADAVVDSGMDSAPPFFAPVVASDVTDQLEAARALVESRFSDAGERLAGSLEMVSRLIEALDRLGLTLNVESVSHTSNELLSTAESLNALPLTQKRRVADLDQLKTAGALLEADIDVMRTTLRYLRAFALNVKITAGATIRAADEFAGFAERMCEQLDFGVSQLDQLAEELTRLARQLDGALTFEQGLGGKYKELIPAVPDKLALDAETLRVNHARIAEVAASVAAIARDIQMKVGKALMALQIGDITRQRIEHVQLGIQVAARTVREADLSPEARDRAERRLLHMVADQMADIATDFEAEAAKVAHSLSGMAQDTKQIMVIHGLSDGGGDLRDLEISLGRAGLLIDDVTAAMTNAQRISGETVSAVEALARRVDAIQKVKRDIQQMAINSSLRCNRLGEIGKPLSVIAIELSSHATHLEDAADQTLGSLTALAGLANGMETTQPGDAHVDAGRLNGVQGQLRRAADVVENDLVGLGAHGEATARSLALAADQLGLKEDLGDALHTAAIALAEAAGPVVEDLTDIAGVVDAAMTEIGRCYTMARERTVHAAHAVFTETDKTDEATTMTETAGETAAAEDEFDDLLF